MKIYLKKIKCEIDYQCFNNDEMEIPCFYHNRKDCPHELEEDYSCEDEGFIYKQVYPIKMRQNHEN